MPEEITTLRSLDDTAAFAARLAARLPAGAVLALDGQLGAGKTSLVRALVGALGGDAKAVTSPTYALLHQYQTERGVLTHVDAYRLHGPAGLAALGFDDLQGSGLACVEWAERVAQALDPQRTWWLTIGLQLDGSRRAALRSPA